MAYELTLTKGERDAFDWVGGRYNGGEVSRLLTGCMGPDDEWSQDGDITFDIPEHIAWKINELAEQEGYAWPCFAPELVRKLNAFCDSIV